MCFIQNISDPATPLPSSTAAKEAAVEAEAEGEEEAKGPSSLDLIEILKNIGIVESTDIGLKNFQRRSMAIIEEEEEAEEGLTSD